MGSQWCWLPGGGGDDSKEQCLCKPPFPDCPWESPFCLHLSTYITPGSDLREPSGGGGSPSGATHKGFTESAACPLPPFCQPMAPSPPTGLSLEPGSLLLLPISSLSLSTPTTSASSSHHLPPLANCDLIDDPLLSRFPQCWIWL